MLVKSGFKFGQFGTENNSFQCFCLFSFSPTERGSSSMGEEVGTIWPVAVLCPPSGQAMAYVPGLWMLACNPLHGSYLWGSILDFLVLSLIMTVESYKVCSSTLPLGDVETSHALSCRQCAGQQPAHEG